VDFENQTIILLVVYSAFSEAVVNGIWHKVGVGSLLFIVVFSMVLLAIVIAINVFAARAAGLTKRMKPSSSAVRKEPTVSRWPTFCSRHQ
jgi:predicted Na+-dependent transporter